VISIKWLSGIRYLLKHPWQFGLSILGVALGVAVVVSIDVANNSARQAFDLSSKSVTGRATDQIVGGSMGVPDSVFREIKIKSPVKIAAPVVEKYVTIKKYPGRSFHLLGVDPFSEAPFRPYLGNVNRNHSLGLTDFITGQNTILIANNTAKEMGVKVGDTLIIKVGMTDYKVRISGLIKPTGDFNREVVRNLMVTDISTAQILLNRPHTLSRIDLIIPNSETGSKWRKDVVSLLPTGVILQPASESRQTIEKLTSAFNLNLSALSMLGLVVGMFLIYNIMTFSVVQRHSLIGRLRALGMTRKEIFRQITGEALIIGIMGTIIGFFLGIILAGELVHMVTRTINDLYYVLSVNKLHISFFTVVKAGSLGVLTTVGAAWIPALEATRTPPGTVMKRSLEEEKLKVKVPRYTMMAVIALLTGGSILLIPTDSITVSYLAMLLIILGFAFLTPAIVIIGMKSIRPALKKIMGISGSMAARNISSQLSRTSVAIAALMVAVSATVGLGIMVQSFRQTLVQWLSTTLQADIYVSAPSLVSNHPDAYMESTTVHQLAEIPGIQAYGTIGRYTVLSGKGEMQLAVVNLPVQAHSSYTFKYGNPEEVWKDFNKAGHVLISEPLSFRKKLKPGDNISLMTPEGTKNFIVAGIYYDYGSSEGSIMMPVQNYRHYWHDYRISGASFYLVKGKDTNQMIKKMQQQIGPGKQLNIRSNRTLREKSLRVFDRTFKITTVLQFLVAGVAFIGVLGALMALELEKMRELGVMRAIGFTPRQIWSVIITETGLMGVIAGLLAIPTGIILATVLIYIINQRSFGWTMQFLIPGHILSDAILLAIAAALLAGLYPSIRMAKVSPAVSLREE
jgi:putative ABC transport system permease protein